MSNTLNLKSNASPNDETCSINFKQNLENYPNKYLWYKEARPLKIKKIALPIQAIVQHFKKEQDYSNLKI